MRLPIVAYGSAILRTRGLNIASEHPNLYELIANMWETMYMADGCGLAAPQVNVPIRLFIVDSKLSYENMDDENRKQYFDGDTGIKQVFINPRIISWSSDLLWQDKEGCLSIPGMSETVERP